MAAVATGAVLQATTAIQQMRLQGREKALARRTVHHQGLQEVILHLRAAFKLPAAQQPASSKLEQEEPLHHQSPEPCQPQPARSTRIKLNKRQSGHAAHEEAEQQPKKRAKLAQQQQREPPQQAGAPEVRADEQGKASMQQAGTDHDNPMQSPPACGAAMPTSECALEQPTHVVSPMPASVVGQVDQQCTDVATGEQYAQPVLVSPQPGPVPSSPVQACLPEPEQGGMPAVDTQPLPEHDQPTLASSPSPPQPCQATAARLSEAGMGMDIAQPSPARSISLQPVEAEKESGPAHTACATHVSSMQLTDAYVAPGSACASPRPAADMEPGSACASPNPPISMHSPAADMEPGSVCDSPMPPSSMCLPAADMEPGSACTSPKAANSMELADADMEPGSVHVSPARTVSMEVAGMEPGSACVSPMPPSSIRRLTAADMLPSPGHDAHQPRASAGSRQSAEARKVEAAGIERACPSPAPADSMCDAEVAMVTEADMMAEADQTVSPGPASSMQLAVADKGAFGSPGPADSMPQAEAHGACASPDPAVSMQPDIEADMGADAEGHGPCASPTGTDVGPQPVPEVTMPDTVAKPKASTPKAGPRTKTPLRSPTNEGAAGSTKKPRSSVLPSQVQAMQPAALPDGAPTALYTANAPLTSTAPAPGPSTSSSNVVAPTNNLIGTVRSFLQPGKPAVPARPALAMHKVASAATSSDGPAPAVATGSKGVVPSGSSVRAKVALFQTLKPQGPAPAAPGNKKPADLEPGKTTTSLLSRPRLIAPSLRPPPASKAQEVAPTRPSTIATIATDDATQRTYSKPKAPSTISGGGGGMGMEAAGRVRKPTLAASGGAKAAASTTTQGARKVGDAPTAAPRSRPLPATAAPGAAAASSAGPTSGSTRTMGPPPSPAPAATPRRTTTTAAAPVPAPPADLAPTRTLNRQTPAKQPQPQRSLLRAAVMAASTPGPQHQPLAQGLGCSTVAATPEPTAGAGGGATGRATGAPPSSRRMAALMHMSADTNYVITPYKQSSGDEEEDSEEEGRGPQQPRKPVPAWAQSSTLQPALAAQAKIDPESIFGRPSTFVLSDVFAGLPPPPADPAKPGKPARRTNYSKRTSSGNWMADRVTWQEELRYKRAMGFLALGQAP